MMAGQATDISAADSGWTQIAIENQNFSVEGTQIVRYGSGSSWIGMSVSGGGACTNAFFGTDPLYGVVKRCEVASSWSRIAGEGERFTVSGTQTVRYGSGSTWITKTVVDAGECSNGYFGSDPVYGVVKQCEVASSAAPAPPPSTAAWTRIAGEGESFAITGTQTVRYGSGSSWVSRSITSGGQCTNGYFGTDPIVGTVKQCEVSGAVASAAGVCTPPVTGVDTSATPPSVGDGTPGSCTESALRTAIADHDVVRFDCGADPVTIPIGAQIDVPAGRNTVIDGGGKVTLDGGRRTRILSLVNPDYRRNSNGLTLQRITLANGQAPGSGYRPQDPSRPQCAWGYADGSGGAIEVRDARLHVIDVEFRNNASASPGPEVGGGAIYAMGSLDVTVVGSRFIGNTGANAGAIGLLQSNGRFVNSVFQGNAADGTGSGRYDADASCPVLVHAGQTGAGGSGGAIAIDGSDDTDLLVCGSRFVDNRANELSGALQRTANVDPRRSTIDRSLFQGNRARQAGALFISNAQPLAIQASTFSNNTADSGGAAQIERSRLDILNSTFAGNQATRGWRRPAHRQRRSGQLDPQCHLRRQPVLRRPRLLQCRDLRPARLPGRQHGVLEQRDERSVDADAVHLDADHRLRRHAMAAQPGRRRRAGYALRAGHRLRRSGARHPGRERRTDTDAAARLRQPVARDWPELSGHRSARHAAPRDRLHHRRGGMSR